MRPNLDRKFNMSNLYGDYSLDDMARAGNVKGLKNYENELHERASKLLETATHERRDLSEVEYSEYDEATNAIRANKQRIQYAEQQTNRISAVSARTDSHEFYSPIWQMVKQNRPTRFELPLGQRLESMSLKARGSFESRDLTTSSVSGAIPSTVFNELVLRLVQSSGVLASNPRIINTENNGAPIKIPTITAYGTAAQIAEGGAFTESDPTASTVTLGAYKFGGMLQLTHELVSDSYFNIENFLGEALGNQVGIAIGSALCTGNGTAAPEGIFTNCTTGVTGGTASPTVANVLSLYASLPTQYRNDASWVMAPATYAGIVNLNDTTGRSLVLNDLSTSQPLQLMGRPVYLDNNAPATAASAKSVWFGSMSNYLYIRYAGELTVDVSTDYAFANDLITYRVRQRLDSKSVNTDAARVFIGS